MLLKGHMAATGSEKCFNLATVSKDWITFSPVAALHSMNSKLYSCGNKTRVGDQNDLAD